MNGALLRDDRFGSLFRNGLNTTVSVISGCSSLFGDLSGDMNGALLNVVKNGSGITKLFSLTGCGLAS